MNIAVSLASGKYIGIVESDDTIEKDMYQTLYNYVVQYDLDFVKRIIMLPGIMMMAP